MTAALWIVLYLAAGIQFTSWLGRRIEISTLEWLMASIFWIPLWISVVIVLARRGLRSL